MSVLVLSVSAVGLLAGQGLDEDQFVVVAYCHGRRINLESYPLEKLTHINYSFLHLRGNELYVDESRQGKAIGRMVALKQSHPDLKIILSFGGWGGCATCSDVFSTEEARKAFAASVMGILEQYGADGIDLDWEYPAIEGYPGHRFAPADKRNFTLLIRELRQALGNDREVTFAAGASPTYLENSVEWMEVMQLVDRVYLMTYDIVNGISTVTGHHTPLFSTPGQKESADFAVHYLDSLGIPHEKIVIGAAFYARMWEDVDSAEHGLFQPGTFRAFVNFRDFEERLNEENGFVFYWDSVAQAPYAYNPTERLFATFDDRRSVALKTEYAMTNRLGGIMFWELTGDRFANGLLDAIDRARKGVIPPSSGRHED